MKLTKTHLKGIVKECLVEILEEGISSASSSIQESRSRKPKRQAGSRPAQKRSSSLDNIAWGQQDSRSDKNPKFEKNVESVTSQMTSDPILSSILADTARTTLQEQVERGGNPMMTPPAAAGDTAARTVATSTPEDLFGGAAANWATLAFSDGKV